jgi:hypothetical protein
MDNNRIKTIFDWLNEISYIRTPSSEFTEDDWKLFNPFMIARFISMESNYCDIVNNIQLLPNLTNKQLYNVYLNYIPKSKKYFKYISPAKEKNDDRIEIIASLLECSKREVKDYFKILNNEQITDILEAYGQNYSSSTKKNKKPTNKRNKL